MPSEKIRVIITGATGMVGEGVLLVCLASPAVEKVLVIVRRPTGMKHPKLSELVHSDFFDPGPVAGALAGYNACFFCLGTTSVGKSADEYYRDTYSLTLAFAGALSAINPNMSFCYVSGAGTDQTEKGRVRWARVKGKTENDLAKLPFTHSFAVRPGFIKPLPGQTHVHSFYRFILWLFPIGRKLSPGAFVTMKELAQSMIRVAGYGFDRNILEGKDIIALARL